MTWHLYPGTKVATCDVNTITQFKKMPESDRHSLVGLFSLRARLSSKTGSVRPKLSRWRPIKEYWCTPLFSKCRNSENNSRNMCHILCYCVRQWYKGANHIIIYYIIILYFSVTERCNRPTIIANGAGLGFGLVKANLGANP